MRLETRASSVWYTRLAKTNVASVKQGLRSQDEDFWPEYEGDPDYTGWRTADGQPEILCYNGNGTEFYLPFVDRGVIEIRADSKGSVLVGRDDFAGHVAGAILATAEPAVAKLREMNTALSAFMNQGGGFVQVLAQGSSLTLAIEMPSSRRFNSDLDIELLVLRSDLGDCTQEHFLGLLVGGEPFAWTEGEVYGADSFVASYFDEMGRHFLDFTSWGQGGEVRSLLT